MLDATERKKTEVIRVMLQYNIHNYSVIRTDKFSDMASHLKGFNSAILKLQLKPQLEANNEDYYILSYFTSSERLILQTPRLSSWRASILTL